MGIYFSVWKKYAQFTGRAGRKEYWVFSLVDFLVMYGIVGISIMLESPVEYEYASTDIGFFEIAYLFYLFGGFLPRLAVTKDQLTLAAADGNKRIDDFQSGLERHRDGSAIHDRGGRPFDGQAPARGNRPFTVEGPAKRVDNPAQ